MRKDPADHQEIVTQLLFGETFTILGKEKQWLRISIHHDDYEGWIDEKQYAETERDFIEKAKKDPSYSLEIAQSAISRDQHIPILMGSTLPLFDGMNFRINKEKYIFNGQAYAPSVTNNKEVLLEKIALKYLNAPYLWGGRSPFGIDCSGFTQVVFKILGIPIKRDTYQQAEQGQLVNFVGDTRPGDMAFFVNQENRIAHVGIALKDEQIIHAYGRVRIDRLDHYGIYNEKMKKYTHKLRVIKRVM